MHQTNNDSIMHFKYLKQAAVLYQVFQSHFADKVTHNIHISHQDSRNLFVSVGSVVTPKATNSKQVDKMQTESLPTIYTHILSSFKK